MNKTLFNSVNVINVKLLFHARTTMWILIKQRWLNREYGKRLLKERRSRWQALVPIIILFLLFLKQSNYCYKREIVLWNYQSNFALRFSLSRTKKESHKSVHKPRRNLCTYIENRNIPTELRTSSFFVSRLKSTRANLSREIPKTKAHNYVCRLLHPIVLRVHVYYEIGFLIDFPSA